MIMLNPNRAVTIKLTPKEQKAIFQYCDFLHSDIYEKIVNVKDGIIILSIEECHYFRRHLASKIEQINKPKIQHILGELFNKLSPDPFFRSLSEELSSQTFENIEQMNERVQKITNARNTTPDPEMGGLSSNQVFRLIGLPWEDENFPIKFNRDLKLPDVKDSIFFTNARVFLKTLMELKNEDTATAKKNLNRKFVRAVFDRLILDAETKADILRFNKVINEEDVMPLHLVKVVCETAELIRCRKKKFLLSKKCQELLSEEKAGELYYLLFLSYFTKFNIGYVDRLADMDCVQRTIGYAFYRLSREAESFWSMEELLSEIFLPGVTKDIERKYSPSLLLRWLPESRIIKPLRKFGLLECKYKEFKAYREVKKVKKTPLFDKFMRFEW